MTGETFAITAVISANIAAFKAGVRQVIGESEKLAGFSKLNAAGIGQAFQKVGGGMTKAFTIPFATIAAGGTKMAISFESAMAGVRKTTDLTEKEFADLTKGINDMSGELPASREEIAGVAEAAGQLGIKKENLLSFTRTMVDLGESTNLQSQEAASALARLANITQMPQSEFSNLGSTIVDLGNNFATTESEIVDMSLRLAGTGKQVGLNESQILALSTAMTSVGINAEAGGSAFSRVMQKMNTAVLSNSEDLKGFANIAGMSAEDFAASWKQNPQTAIINFTKGLKRAQDGGKDVITMLKKVGINGIRETDTLQRLANAGDLMGDAFKVSSKAWDENSALSKEAGMRYKTTESQLKIVKNTLIKAAGAIGQVLAPKLVELADKVKAAANWFTNLSLEMQGVILKVAGFVAAAGPALLIFSKLISFGSGVKGSIGKLALGFTGLGTKLGNFSSKLSFFPKVFGGIFSSIGQFLGKLATPFVKFGGIVKGVFVAGLGHVKSFLLGFGPIQAVVGKVGGLFSALAGKLGLTAAASGEAAGGLAAIGGAAGPLLAVVAVVGFFVAAIKTAWDTSASFRESVKNAIQGVVDSFNNFKSALGDLGAAISPVLGYVKELWHSIVGALTPVFSALAGIVGGVVSGAFSILSGVVGAVAKVFRFLSPAIGPLLSIFSAIAGFVGSILAPVLSGLGKLLGFLGKIFGEVGKAIGDFASWIFDKLGPVIDFIGGAFKGVADFIGGVTNGIKGFTDKIGLTSSEVEKSNEAIATSTEIAISRTAKALGNVDVHADNTTLKMQQMGSGVSTATELMAQSTQQNVAGMSSEVGNIFDLMNSNALTSTETMSTGISGVLVPMTSQVPEQFRAMASSSILQMQQMGISSVEEADALVSGVGVKWEEMSSWTEEQWASVNDAVTTQMANASMDASMHSSDMVATMGDDFSMLETNTDDIFGNINNSITQGMDTSSAEAIASAQGLDTDVSSTFESMYSGVDSSMGNITKSVSTQLDSAVKAAKSSLKTLSSSFNAGFDGISKQVTSSMAQFSTSIQSSMASVQKIAIASINSLRSAFQAGFSGITTISNQALSGLIKTATVSFTQIRRVFDASLVGMLNATKTAMTGISSTVVSGCRAALSSVQSYRGGMWSAGYNLSLGLSSGIYNGRSAVISAAASVAASAIYAAKSRLRIHSPSRVARDVIGVQYTRGIAEGIEEKQGLVESAAKQVSNAALNAYNMKDLDVVGRFGDLFGGYTRVEHEIKAQTERKNPAEIILRLGDRELRGFTADLNAINGREIRLTEQYGF